MIISIVYGTSMEESERDDKVDCMNIFTRRLARTAAPGAYLVELFPIIRHLPDWLAPWKRRLNGWHRENSALFSSYVDEVEQAIVS